MMYLKLTLGLVRIVACAALLAGCQASSTPTKDQPSPDKPNVPADSPGDVDGSTGRAEPGPVPSNTSDPDEGTDDASPPPADPVSPADPDGDPYGGPDDADDGPAQPTPPTDPIAPNDPGIPTSGGSCASGLYIGDIGGAQAVAQIELTQLPEYVVLAGEINSGPYYYTFSADMYGASGYGDLVDHTDGSRIRIQIDALQNGFVMTTNVFEGAGSTQYAFTCQ